MPNPNDLTARCLFRFNVNDGLNGQSLLARSFATEIATVFARSGVKRITDQNGVLVPIAAAVVPVTVIGGEKAALLEPAGTNLVVQSEDFNTTWTKSGVTVSVNSVTAPDGTLTADLLTSGGGGAGEYIRATPTFTADGTKCVSVFVKAGSSAETRISVYDRTAAAFRQTIRLLWSGGVPSASVTSGTGTLYPVEALANGWYRILFSADSIVAANTNDFIIYPTGFGTVAGTIYAWGAQAENAVVPSSYIPTTTATANRAADSCYFTLPGLNPPRALTFYVRSRNVGQYANTGANRFLLHVGAENNGTDPRFNLRGNAAGAASLSAEYDDGVTARTATATASPTPAFGDVVEHRGVLHADWTVTAGASVNGAAETTAVAAASAAASGWAAARLYLAGALTSQNTPCAYTHVVVAEGARTLAEMRELAGVS